MRKINPVLIFGILLFVLSAYTTSAMGTLTINYFFVRSWGGEADQILNPQGIAWGKNGKIYVANRNLHRITVISTQGDTYRTWGYQGYSGPLEFQNTDGVAADAEGYVYATDGNGYVTKITGEGQFVTRWYLSRTKAVAVDSQGTVFVLRNSIQNSAEKYVHLFTKDGQFINSWGDAGSGLGNLWWPGGIAVDDQFVYIADSENNRVQKFTHAGGFVAVWGSEGSAAGQFSKPQGIALAKNGSVYVADTGNNRIQVFSATGTYLDQWGTPGSQPGQFKSPGGISINEGGVLLVSDSLNNRIQMFAADGSYLRQFGAAKGYSSTNDYTGLITVDSSHNIYIVNDQLNMVQKFSENMELIKSWSSHYQSRIYGIGFDAGGYLYISSSCRIQKFDLDGNWIKEWSAASGCPTYLAVDSNHNVFVTWSTLETYKFDQNGVLLTSWPKPDGNWVSMAGIAVDGANNVYIADPNFSSIYQFNNSGGYIKKIGSFNGPTGLAAYADIIYIADQFNNRVYAYNSAGSYLANWGAKGVGPGKFVWPQYIATYNAQDVYVIDGNGLQKFSTSRNPGVANGSFEDSRSLFEWTFGGNLKVQRGTSAADGSFSLQLGVPAVQVGQGEGFGWAHQTIYVDPGMVRPVLYFDYRIFANDIFHYSDFYVQIQDGTGRNYQETLLRDGYNPCSSGSSPGPGTDLGWRIAKMDLSKYKGTSIRVVFAIRNLWPDSLGAWAFVDHLRMEEAGPLPPAGGPLRVYLPVISNQHCDAAAQAGLNADVPVRKIGQTQALNLVPGR